MNGTKGLGPILLHICVNGEFANTHFSNVMASIASLNAVLRSILEGELARKSDMLPVEHCKILLLSENSSSLSSVEVGKYPKYPLYLEISKKLH